MAKTNKDDTTSFKDFFSKLAKQIIEYTVEGCIVKKLYR